MASCKITPNKRGTKIPSPLFKELLNLTQNRDLTVAIWAMATQTDIVKDEVGNAISAIDNLGIAESLPLEVYAKYVNAKEHLNSTTSLKDAVIKQDDLKEKYSNITTHLSNNKGKFTVTAVPATRDNTIEHHKQKGLIELNNKLLDIVNRLGFAVKEVDSTTINGKFDPLAAETNAEGLIEAITIAKTLDGKKALTEEVTHLLVAGLKNNPLLNRLMSNLNSNFEIVQDILGDEFEQYNELYKGDKQQLIEEAVGKLIAQHIVNREGLSSEISYISNKVLNSVLDKLAKGDKRLIQDAVASFNDYMDDIVNKFIDPEYLSREISKAGLLNSKALFNISNKINSIEDLIKESQFILAKKFRIERAVGRQGAIVRQQLAVEDKMQQAVDTADNLLGVTTFLNYIVKDCADLQQRMEQAKQIAIQLKRKAAGSAWTSNDKVQLFGALDTLKRIEDLFMTYSDIMRKYPAFLSDPTLTSVTTQATIDDLLDITNTINQHISNIDKIRVSTRVDVLSVLLKDYWGDKDIDIDYKDKNYKITLEDVIQSNLGDVTVGNLYFNSLADSKDLYLQLIDRFYKNAQHERDSNIRSLQQRLGNLTQEYIEETGSRDLSWMYERDENGNLTGNYISNIDFIQYNKDKAAYIESIKHLTATQQAKEIKKWIASHTQSLKYASGTQVLPNSSYYSGVVDDLKKTDPIKYKYYMKIMEIKDDLDLLLPARARYRYRAPQKKLTVTEAVINNGNAKAAIKRVGAKFVTDSDDTQYGQKGTYTMRDLKGDEVKKVPIYYNTRLKDMSQLDTNTLDALLSYGAMAINYNVMNHVSKAMEVLYAQALDRNITKMNGAKKLFERFIGNKGKVYEQDYIIKGTDSNMAKMLRYYIDKNIYSQKHDLNTVTIGKKDINISKVSDFAKSWSSIAGLGFNTFSATANVSMGILQTILKASLGSQHPLNVKSLMKASKVYSSKLPSLIGEQYKDVKTDPIYLLLEKLDVFEDYYQSLDSNNYSGGLFKKLIAKFSPYIGQSMGEHLLHALPALSIISNTKLYKKDSNGNLTEVSFFDAIEVVDKQTSISKSTFTIKELALKSDIVKENGEEFTEDDWYKLKTEIQKTNRAINGAFSEADKGMIHKVALGRLVMNFRQWMPAFYQYRFKGIGAPAFNLDNKDTMDTGIYIEAWNFLSDAFTLKGNFIKAYNNLSPSNRRKVLETLREAILFVAFGILLSLLAGGGDDDDKDVGDSVIGRLAIYNLYRVKMELGASNPYLGWAFVSNATTLINSPIPALKLLDTYTKLFDFTAIFREVEHGKYKGMNEYLKNVRRAAGPFTNIYKFSDFISGDDTIFNPYK